MQKMKVFLSIRSQFLCLSRNMEAGIFINHIEEFPVCGVAIKAVLSECSQQNQQHVDHSSISSLVTICLNSETKDILVSLTPHYHFQLFSACSHFPVKLQFPKLLTTSRFKNLTADFGITYCLLQCDVIQSGTCLLTFRKRVFILRNVC